MSTSHLSREQVLALNEKHGWFQYGDAQSDVSRAFAQDAIEVHERQRAAAPEMLAALRETQIALGLMLNYHGQGTADHADVAQVRAQEAFDLVDALLTKLGATP